MRSAKRNIERMIEAVPDSDWQTQQHFITHSPWDAFALMDQIARDVNSAIGNDPDSCFIIDESGFTKKGKESVGVSRQWNGRLGKVDNCQVGVFGALNCRKKVSLVDVRLFLPVNWATDKKRCLKAKIPKNRIAFHQKTEQGLDLVKSNRQRGLTFNWVGADGFYGNDPVFTRELDRMGETFMLDVHNDQTIYLEDPTPYVPKRQSRRGRTPSRLTTDVQRLTVSQWAKSQPIKTWQKVFIRNSTKGRLINKVLHQRVWLWDGKEQHAHQWHLIVSRKKGKSGELKYSLSNAAPDTPVSRLAFMQNQRYWVERALQDGKSNAGMAEYQVRTWPGWHHHMAMVMLVMLFMLKAKLIYEKDYDLLSCFDVRILLFHFLPKRETSKDEVIRQMLIRHMQRKKSILYNLNLLC